jgi:hypothetical protein
MAAKNPASWALSAFTQIYNVVGMFLANMHKTSGCMKACDAAWLLVDGGVLLVLPDDNAAQGCWCGSHTQNGAVTSSERMQFFSNVV